MLLPKDTFDQTQARSKNVALYQEHPKKGAFHEFLLAAFLKISESRLKTFTAKSVNNNEVEKWVYNFTLKQILKRTLSMLSMDCSHSVMKTRFLLLNTAKLNVKLK